MTSNTKRKDLAPPKSLQLQNRFHVLKVKEKMCRQAKYLFYLTPKPHKARKRKKQQVMVMGDSLLWGTQVNPNNHLERPVVCQGPGSGMLWGSLGPLTTTP